jgi:hypothetical protein
MSLLKMAEYQTIVQIEIKRRKKDTVSKSESLNNHVLL